MTDKELRRLSRAELLQLMLEQARENEQLRGEVSALREQLEQQKITCENIGSLAEAALAINNVFQAADRAAQQYLQEVSQRVGDQDRELHEKYEQAQNQVDTLIWESQEKATAILGEAEASAEKIRAEAEAHLNLAKVQAEELLNNARAEAEACTERAKTESDEIRAKANAQIQALVQVQNTLNTLFDATGKKSEA